MTLTMSTCINACRRLQTDLAGLGQRLVVVLLELEGAVAAAAAARAALRALAGARKVFGFKVGPKDASRSLHSCAWE